jgi:DnaJ-class molecular chaperone
MGVFVFLKGGDGRWKKAGGPCLINGKGGIQMVIATDDLEIACPHCERAGEIEGKPCPACSGKGVILTAQGNTLLDFIQKHMNK